MRDRKKKLKRSDLWTRVRFISMSDVYPRMVRINERPFWKLKKLSAGLIDTNYRTCSLNNSDLLDDTGSEFALERVCWLFWLWGRRVIHNRLKSNFWLLIREFCWINGTCIWLFMWQLNDSRIGYKILVLFGWLGVQIVLPVDKEPNSCVHMGKYVVLALIINPFVLHEFESSLMRFVMAGHVMKSVVLVTFLHSMGIQLDRETWLI